MKLKKIVSILNDCEWIDIQLHNKTLYSGIVRELSIKYYMYEYKVINLCEEDASIVITIIED